MAIQIGEEACKLHVCNLLGAALDNLDVLLTAWKEKGEVPEEFAASLQLATSAASSLQAATTFLRFLHATNN